jgi:nitrate reductase NapE component
VFCSLARLAVGIFNIISIAAVRLIMWTLLRGLGSGRSMLVLLGILRRSGGLCSLVRLVVGIFSIISIAAVRLIMWILLRGPGSGRSMLVLFGILRRRGGIGIVFGFATDLFRGFHTFS